MATRVPEPGLRGFTNTLKRTNRYVYRNSDSGIRDGLSSYFVLKVGFWWDVGKFLLDLPDGASALHGQLAPGEWNLQRISKADFDLTQATIF